MTYEEKARALFLEGYNCSQAVFCAFCDQMGMDEAMAKRISSSFGGGMGRLREVCGAVSGMFLVIGALYGYEDKDNQRLKKEHYERIQYLAGEFQEEFGSIICRDLLGLGEGPSHPKPAERTKEYYQKRPCADNVAFAAKLVEEYIKEYPYETGEVK